ncbi:hypothetical protein FACS1894170_12990 [Planctomycetales bacterium]|nr:hypothetical protein FACS1894170_12990 [Planctomycetales bacterium]
MFREKEYAHILKKWCNNFYAPIVTEVKKYFSENKISWWGGENPTGNVLSSQIACLNHLFYIRNDKSAVLDLVKQINGDFVDVLEIRSDKFSPAYIQFEAVSNKDWLNECKEGNNPTRGSKCTSIDALIYAVNKNGRKYLLPIEWKYKENYGNQNKSNEERRCRYTDLINQSKQLKMENHTVYYYEPFYQLMRQTLWAEQVIKHQSTETIKADDFIHIHVVPTGNTDLLEKIYSCSKKTMEKTWRGYLVNQEKYRLLSPQELLASINRKTYAEFLEYLAKRYWLDIE